MKRFLSLKPEMETIEIKTDPRRLKNLVVGDKIFRSAYDYQLSPDDLERARVELNETEEVRNASLRTLKKMLLRDDVRNRTDDAHLLRFLRCKKFNCKRAYEMIRSFYSARKDYPEVFSTLPSENELKNYLENKIATYLPYRDEDGSLIFVNKIGNWNPKEQTVYELFKVFQPVGAVVNMNPCAQINKIEAILDFEGINMSYAPAALHPRTLLFWTKSWPNVYPWRIKRIILVNCNRIVCTAFNSVRYLLKKKITDRIIVIGSDVTELHQYVNPALLPGEYGGSLEDSEWRFTQQHVMDNLRYVEYEHSFFDT